MAMEERNTAPNALRIEQDAFDARLDEFMIEHAGQFVAFAGGKPLGFFPTYEDAYNAGLEKMGVKGVFLVSEVRKRAASVPSISWYTGAMFVEG